MGKGFTLIELLAVIVILAIVALIATPLILNVIEDSKKRAFENTAYGIIEATELKYAMNMVKGINQELIFTYDERGETPNIEGQKLEYKGEKPQNGEVRVNQDGRIAMAIHNGEYCAQKWYSEDKLKIKEKSLNDCFLPYDDTVGAPIPKLDEGMIPIKWNENKWIKASIKEEWYDYGKQEWANMVLVEEERREYYQNNDNVDIIEEDILAYLVWVPRYKYKLFNVNSVINGGEKENGEIMTEQEIEITFEYSYRQKANGKNDGEWLTHPAFTFGDKELNGFWVGKFETGTLEPICSNEMSTDNCNNENQIPIIKPNVTALRYQIIQNQFTTAKKFNNPIFYGITNAHDAHMMKNTEWGAVAYLSHSKYGKYGNDIYTGNNREIYQNKGNYETGLSNGTPSQTSYKKDDQCLYSDIVDMGNGIGACGAGASTTGNIYGIYDMSGGATEYVMGAMYNSSNMVIMRKTSGFTESIDSNEFTKYIDKYLYGPIEDEIPYQRQILGDATGETLNWYSDDSLFVSSDGSWFIRGGAYNNGVVAGIFYFNDSSGGANASRSFRVVVSSSN